MGDYKDLQKVHRGIEITLQVKRFHPLSQYFNVTGVLPEFADAKALKDKLDETSNIVETEARNWHLAALEAIEEYQAGRIDKYRLMELLYPHADPAEKVEELEDKSPGPAEFQNPYGSGTPVVDKIEEKAKEPDDKPKPVPRKVASKEKREVVWAFWKNKPESKATIQVWLNEAKCNINSLSEQDADELIIELRKHYGEPE